MPSLFETTEAPKKSLFNQPMPGDPLASVGDPLLGRPDPLGGMGFEAKPKHRSLFSDEEESPSLFETKQTPYEAGQDAMQALWGSGLEAIAEASGGDPDNYKMLSQWVDAQKEMSENTDINSFGDKLEFALGQISVGALPALGAAVIAPLVGTTTATGALVVGTMGEILGSTGELRDKALALDPEYKASMGTLAGGAVAGAVGIPQLKRFMPAIKPMEELLQDVGKATVNGVESVNLKKIASGTLKTAATSGATEAIQDVGTSVAAHALTGNAIDSSKARAMASAAVDEFLIGSIVGGGVGVLASTAKDVAQRQAVYDERKLAEFKTQPKRMPLQDHTGELDPKAIVPVPGAPQNPGMWNLRLTSLLGKAPDYIRRKFQDNKYVQTFAQQFHNDPLNPQMGINTINEDAAVTKGNLDGIADAILRADPVLVEEAGERRAMKTPDLTNPIDKAIIDLYDVAIPSEYNRVGRGKVDMSSRQWTGGDYLPNHNRINYEEMALKPDEAKAHLSTTMLKEGRTAEEVTAAQKKLDRIIKEQNEKGNQMWAGRELDEDDIERMQDIVENLQDEDVNPASQMAAFLNIRRERNSTLKKGPLNLVRELPEAPQAFWQKYADKGVSLKDAIAMDIKKKAEHLAYADKFGFDNEVAIELIGNAFIESTLPGRKQMTVADMDNMFDVLRLQQRIPSKRLTPPMRRFQTNLKSYTGTMILGASALMSVPEVIISGYKTGINSWAVGAYRGIKDKSKESQTETLASMEDAGAGWYDASSIAAARIGETINEMPKWETWLIQKLSFLPHVQFALRTQTIKAADHYLRRQLDTLASPDISPALQNSIKRKLYQAGIKPDEAMAWKKRGYNKYDEYYNSTWMPKIYREMQHTIIEPHPVDKPIWMSDEHFTLISQLKSFVFGFQNLVLNDSYNKMRMEGPGKNRELILKAAPYLATYILGQAGILSLRELMREGELDEEKGLSSKVIMAISSQGSLSILGDAYHGLAGRSGLLESFSPFAGFINRQIKGNTKLVKDIIKGEISPEQAVFDVVRNNAPTTLADPLVSEAYREVFSGVER